MSDIEVIVREPAVVVGVPVIAGFSELAQAVPAAWESLRTSLGGHLGGRPSEPLAEASVELGGGRYHETVGVFLEPEAAGAVRIPGTVHTLVPGGRWAQATHDGPVEDIAETFGRILRWAAAQGHRPGPRKLDVGYRLDRDPGNHLLAVELS